LRAATGYHIRTKARNETNTIIPLLNTTHLDNNTINIVNECVITSIEDIPDQCYDNININEDHASINNYSEPCIFEIEHNS